MQWCEEWGDTDFLLTQARRKHDSLYCTCGCGQWAGESHDPANADQYVVEADGVCFAGEALAQWRRTHRDDPDDESQDGQLYRLRLVKTDD